MEAIWRAVFPGFTSFDSAHQASLRTSCMMSKPNDDVSVDTVVPSQKHGRSVETGSDEKDPQTLLDMCSSWLDGLQADDVDGVSVLRLQQTISGAASPADVPVVTSYVDQYLASLDVVAADGKELPELHVPLYLVTDVLTNVSHWYQIAKHSAGMIPLSLQCCLVAPAAVSKSVACSKSACRGLHGLPDGCCSLHHLYPVPYQGLAGPTVQPLLTIIVEAGDAQQECTGIGSCSSGCTRGCKRFRVYQVLKYDLCW